MSDLISRQTAIEALVKRTGLNWKSLKIVEPMLDVLEQLPSTEPERKKGRWISRDGEEDCYECSECHAVIEGDEVYWRNNYFCYHCGADMRGKDDGIDG